MARRTKDNRLSDSTSVFTHDGYSNENTNVHKIITTFNGLFCFPGDQIVWSKVVPEWEQITHHKSDFILQKIN